MSLLSGRSQWGDTILEPIRAHGVSPGCGSQSADERSAPVPSTHAACKK